MPIKSPQADRENLYRIFTVAESADSTLSKIERQISSNLSGFLQQHIVSNAKDLAELEADFVDTDLPEEPIFVSQQADYLLNQVVAHSVHTASPTFIGHMTSALPNFMLSLSKIMIALNQNLVKIETSKVFTPLERQVIGMLHRLIFQKASSFYQRTLHDSESSLGAFCSGGTLANVTALWVARNRAFPKTDTFPGIGQAGLYRALKHYGYEGVAILVSRRGHYSLSKTADVLGIGRQDFYAIAVDAQHKIQIELLRQQCEKLQQQRIKVVAIVGVAGSSETGSVDPLTEMAAIAKQFDVHFHVDAAWGGPTLFSQTYRHLLRGIEQADSVTLDAHKQLYVPMGAGMVFFKDPRYAASIQHHAQYIVRKGSKDLGRYSLEGSRPGMAMLVQSGLKIMGRKGYEVLIDVGLEKAKRFAKMIDSCDDFQLISAPELNLLTYRYVPADVYQLMQQKKLQHHTELNAALNRITKQLQKTQRARGKSFVSRTKFGVDGDEACPVIVFRVVLANPLTTEEMLEAILQEQRDIAQEDFLVPAIHALRAIAQAA
jgi:glutamate decarboxylase